MSLPKVSVVIPNYNHGSYLKQRIDSVLYQTYRDFEIIILDDCSSDNSREIINDYVGNPLVSEVVFNDKNSGSPFRQWQRGVGLSKGEWIWFAESDDYADEKFLEILISEIGNKLNIGLVYCDSNIVSGGIISNETFATIKNEQFKTRRWNGNYSNNGSDEIENYLLPGGTINNSSAVLFNKKALVAANPFNLNLKHIGDKYAFIKVLAKTDVIYVNERLNYYRGTLNAKSTTKFIFYFYEQFLIFDWVSKNLEIKNREKFLVGFYSNTGNSLFRDWNVPKIRLYKKLFVVNRCLLIKSILHNFLQSIRSVFKHV